MTTSPATPPGIIDRPQNPQLGILLLLAGIVLFVSGEVCVKLLAQDHSITQVVWARYTFHALVTFVIFQRVGMFANAKTTRPWLHLARSALMLAATACFFTALRYLPLADAVAISFLAPLMVTAFSIPILKEKVGPRRWAAIAVGFVGTMIIIRPGTAAMHWAAILPLGSAVCYALYQILTRIATRTDTTNTSLFWMSAFGVVATSLLVPFAWTNPSLEAWALMLALGSFYGFGHYLLIRGLELTSASMLSPFLYTQVIWATIFGLLIFDQFPDMWTLIGVGIVIASGLYIWRREVLLGN